MKNLIHKYLNEFYHIKGDHILNLKSDNDISSYIMVFHLGKIFDLNKKELKWYVKSWVKKQSKGFDFNKWWTPPKYGVYFPMVKKIAARTIGTDLVQVQPMGAPTGYVYAPYIPVLETPRLGELDHVTPNEELVARYATREVNPNYYGVINVGQPVGVSSRAPNREETIRRWSESGLLDGLRGHVRENIAELYQAQLRQVIN
jgi:hypothetical protein